ncbi:acyltransferase [Pseudoduganella ginsengisoli]|uniref:Acyltransferase family protein n=1 Tax=Pseudoduganella ginsengisoli TaxID=1462440 RepID=A0A6L6PY80_9BURK|nr:acyltransferase [Pseudoduganella ginsengisoli]MTW02573.1 acyltransferase family protein [Pseudoduganella ginsengisoli]
MNRSTSLYLDLVRFSAAMVVMLGHLAGKRFTDGVLWRLGGYMDDAVMVFFVLSGFVIAYVVHQKETDATAYGISRAARIYSVAIPALVLTFALDTAGKHYAPELYSMDWGYTGGNPVWQFFAGLFFVNQLWYNPIEIGSNLPYWSLGFEVWYYLFFAIFYFGRSSWKWLWLAIAIGIAGPRIAIFFPIWMLGYGAYVWTARRKPGQGAGLLLLALSVAGYALYCYFLKPGFNSGGADVGQFHNLLPRYIVGPLFALHLAGFVWASDLFGKWLALGQKPIRWLAGTTFTIYLFHLPVAQCLATLVPWAPADWRTRLVILPGTLILMFVIAEFSERKKEVWNRWISSVFQRAGVAAR